MRQHPIPMRLGAFLLCFALLVGLLPVTAWAVDNVQYIDADGTTKTCASATDIASNSTTWSTGWYVVNSNVTISSRITVSGEVNLILADGWTLTASAGITVSQGNSLTIYAQSTGNSKGQLIAGVSGTIAGNYAGIGGVWDRSSPGTPGTSGTITINGGTVTAQGGSMGAGIGGGNSTTPSNTGGTVNINGGTVTATGGLNGAGIGGGMSGVGGTVNITGGNVTATGGNDGAGIGGGLNGAGGIITISGGTVTATGNISEGGSAAGIGGGSAGAGGSVTITGGTITAVGKGSNGKGIGNSSDYAGNGTCSISGSAVVFASSDRSTPIGATSGSGSWNGIVFQGNSGQVYGDVTLEDDLTISDGKTLTVPDGSTLTIPEGVTVTGGISTDSGGTVNNSGTVTGGVTGGGTENVLSTVSVNASSATATYGGSVTLTATVTGGTGTVNSGTVTFYRGDSTTGTVLNSGGTTVSNGTATLNNVQINSTNGFTTGSNTITAVYSGGTGLLGNSGTAALTVSAAQLAVPSGLSLTSSEPGKATASWGAAANASGYSVQLYKDNSAEGATVSVSSGTAYTFDISAAGSYAFTVTATGSGGYTDSNAATSSPLTFYTVTFVSGSTTLETQYVANNGNAALPSTNPTPSDNTQYFAGWVYGNDNTPFTSGTQITGDTAVSASFADKTSQTAAAPTWSGSTTDSITINTVRGQRYAITDRNTAPGISDNGWTEAAESDGAYTFSNLTAPGAAYYIWTYLPGGEQTLDSPVSAALTACTAPEITTDSLTAATVDESYSATLAAAAADGSTVTWSATGLPDGLTLDSTTGIISGIPTTATGDSGAAVTVTAAVGTGNNAASSSQQLSLVVNAGTMTGSVTISGDAIFDETLTANYTGSAKSVSYQWYRGSAAISGATGSAYTLVEADIGSTIHVVAASADNDYTGSVDSEATAAVAKAAGVIEISCPDVVYGNNVTVTVVQNTNAGADVIYSYSGTGSTSYGPSKDAPAAVGAYSVTATVEETSTHTSATDTVTFSIAQSGSSLDVQPSGTSLTYGETLAIAVTPRASGTAANGINTLTARDTVELIYDGDVIASDSDSDGDGTYTLRYDTALKRIPVGSNTLTVSYGGSADMAASSTAVPITLNAKAVTASVSGAPSKPYDTGTEITVALLVNDLEDGDSLTGTVTGTFADANVGTGKSITLGNNPVWTDTAAAGFYNISLPAGVTGTITRAAISSRPVITGSALPGGTLTASYTPVTGETVSFQWNLGGSPISGATGNTYTVREADAGYEITVTATATDGNHTGSMTSEAVTAGKAEQDAPPAPQPASTSRNSITLAAMNTNPATGAAVQYGISRDNGVTWAWQDSPAFTGLSPGTAYLFAARYVETERCNASPNSASVSIRTSSGGSSSRPTQPAGPSTDGSRGWSSIRDEISGARDGGSITIDMNGETEVPGEILGEVAGKDVDVTFRLGGEISWTVNGLDVPEAARLRDLDLGVEMGTSNIPVHVVNTVTGGVGAVQITLVHDGAFGFAMTLTAPLGRENRGLWANLYHYDEAARELALETSAIIDRNGDVSLRFSHASQYAIIIDETSHDPETAELPFTDVPEGYWAYDAIEYVYGEGLMAGTSGTTFSPNDTTTRGQIVTILWRMAGSPVVDCLMDYSDVAPAAYYGEAIRWATSEGVVGGYGNGTFGPNDPITREQLAVMLYRCARYEGYDTTQGGMVIREYADYDQISNFALEALDWAVSAGIINGTSGTTLAPQSGAARAQAAVMLERFCEQYQ